MNRKCASSPVSVTSIAAETADYPDGLRATDWPVIWKIGDSELLEVPWAGLLCSGKCPGAAILALYDLARAMRDAGIAVVSGFHSPVERDCLPFLLRGNQPLAICPARSLERMRIPQDWRAPLQKKRLLVLSPFGPQHRRVNASLASQRNRFVAAMASVLILGYAEPGSRTEQLGADLLEAGRSVIMLEAGRNDRLQQAGAEVLSLEHLLARLPWPDSRSGSAEGNSS